MSLEHVCVKYGVLFCAIICSAVVLWLLHLKDSDFSKCEGKEVLGEYLLFCGMSVVLLYGKIGEYSLCIQACYAGMLSYLIVTAVMDSQLQQVSNFLHVIGAISGGVLAICKQSDSQTWGMFLGFCLIQILVFGRMYGAADVLEFLVCAIFFTAVGRAMETYLTHMALTFVLLGVVQLFQKNINRRGNLKTPVPLVPYIAISFLVII